jgi:hypothetical protein
MEMVDTISNIRQEHQLEVALRRKPARGDNDVRQEANQSQYHCSAHPHEQSDERNLHHRIQGSKCPMFCPSRE